MKKIVWSAVASLVLLAACAYAGVFSFLMSANYLPHQFCYLAQPGMVWTNVSMDGLIAGSYLAIFLALFWLAFKLRRLPAMRSYLWIFFAFGTFIIACGLTHVMEMVTVWWPVYRMAAAMKVICALASVPTAVLFIRIVPGLTTNIERFLAMLSTTQQEKEQALASLIASEKLAVAGRIAASIAHEIKNPLDSVGNLLHLLRTDPGVTEEMLPLIDTAQSEIVRAGHIARSTLSLYRDSSAPMPVALGALLESVIDLQTGDFVKNRIRVQTRVVTPVGLHGYPSELRQILINLLQNAASAIGENGRILVRVQPRAGGYSLTVADTGSGIPAELRERMFSLFFTTKGEHGTGLGLWLVQSLVEKHGGRIRFRSRVAGEAAVHGTVFNVWLPLGPALAEPALAAMASESGERSRPR